MFKKIYIEITNACNFSCSFCYPSLREKRFMTVAEFHEIVRKIRPFTNYIYLHVLGEPLLHLQLDELLGIARNAGLLVNITTNGSLLLEKQDILKQNPIRLINISMHDMEENLPAAEWGSYLADILFFAQEITAQTYVCLRLWNRRTEEISQFNQLCLSKIKELLNLDADISPFLTRGNGIKLRPNIFLQNENRFEWQSSKSVSRKNCLALKDHIAILSDGSVVPCCIDAGARLHLGNIFNDDLTTILNSERAQHIKKGFQGQTAVEAFCRTCGFFR